MDFDKCELLRVLDLEGCTWLENAHLDTICKLLYLKYLSLRSTRVSKLPKKMKDLHCLETLDARDTRIEMLPMEVLRLPQLEHLFGEFELPAELGDDKRKDKLRKFFSEKSRLQTLAGFKIVNNNRGFEQILLHCGKLSKVKIWCKILPPAAAPPPRRPISKLASYFKKKNVPSLTETLVSSLSARFTRLDSLSIDFDGICKNFLDSVLKAPSTLSSVKIWGEMESLPNSSTLSMLRNLRELHLSNTGLSSQVLSSLQSLDCLVCLRLTEDRPGLWDDGTFHVEPKKFQSLLRICFHGPELPSVKIEHGGMPRLISLHLVCKEPEKELRVEGITHLQHLNEVMLHPDASEEKMQAWKRAAVEHKNRPYVIKQPSCNVQA
jgi:disease resistance protein RPM1